MSDDMTVKVLMKRVEEKRVSLGKKFKFSPKTNCKFTYPTGEYFNLNVETDFDKYAKALSFLISRARDYEEACKRLGIKCQDFVWDGYTINDWEDDFKARIESIKWDIERKNLDGLESRLANLISEEGKKKIELDKITALLQ